MFSQLIWMSQEPFATAELNYRRERIMRSYPRRSRRQGEPSLDRLRLRRHLRLPWPRRRARQRTAVA
ncbi:MAG: hypothetical protein ACRDPB_09440 [Nocardioidaceae bacterium]